MKEYEHTQLTHENLLLVVTSTYGNGEPPENGTSFSSYLQSMKNSVDTRPLKNLKYEQNLKPFKPCRFDLKTEISRRFQSQVRVFIHFRCSQGKRLKAIVFSL